MAKKFKGQRGKWCYERSPGNWWYDFKLKGDIRRRNPLPGVTTKTTAEIAAAAIVKRQADINAGLITPDQIRETVTGEVAVSRFYDEVAKDYKAARNARCYGDNLIYVDPGAERKVLSPIGRKTLVELERSDVINHIEKRKREGVSDATIYHDIAYLRRVVKCARFDWLYRVNPDLDLTKFRLKGSPKRDRTMTFEQETQLLDEIRAMRPDFLPVFIYLFAAGQRSGASIALRWGHIKWQQGDHGIIRQIVKGGREHTVPLTAELAGLIRLQEGKHPTHVFTYLPRMTKRFKSGLFIQKGVPEPFNRTTHRDMWDTVRAKLGLENFTRHDIRHVVLTHIRDLTNDITQAQNVAGHSKPGQTADYIGGAVKNTAKALATLEAAKRPPSASTLDAEIERVEAHLAALKAARDGAGPTNNVVLLRRNSG